MGSNFIDRRLQGKNKSLPNRERFVRRYKEKLKAAVERKASSSSIKDLAGGQNMRVRIKTTEEPSIVYGAGGDTKRVLPGNEHFVAGDTIDKPQGGGNGGGGREAGKGEGEENFDFVLSKDEFLGMYFNDLELPNLLAKQSESMKQTKPQTAGYSLDGNPSQLAVVKTFKGALARKIALTKEPEHIRQLRQSIEDEKSKGNDPKELIAQLEQWLANRKKLPFLDEIDLRYRNRIEVAKPSTKAVMFCVMDVSASMTRELKELSKRFFMLLYLFLTSKYEDVELVFICHTDTAEEVDEYTFFHGHRTGGTEVWPALKMVDDIVASRFDPSQYNIYLAQSSDGDAARSDSIQCAAELENTLSRYLRHFAYVEVSDKVNHDAYRDSEMLECYQKLEQAMPSTCIRVSQPEEIFPKFRKMFEKR